MNLQSRVARAEQRAGPPAESAVAQLRSLLLDDPEAMDLARELWRRADGLGGSPRYAGISGEQLFERFTACLAAVPNSDALRRAVAMAHAELPPSVEPLLRVIRGH